MRRRIKQVAVATNRDEDILLALCEDGTLWKFTHHFDPITNKDVEAWTEVTTYPGDEDEGRVANSEDQ